MGLLSLLQPPGIHGTNAIFSYIYHKIQPNYVGTVHKYISPMDGMGDYR